MRAVAAGVLALILVALALGLGRLWSDPLYQADEPPRLIFPRRDQ